MAHYAILDENGIVTSVIVGRDEDDDQGQNWEAYYGARHGAQCKRTSYNTRGGVHRLGGVPFRKNFAAIGYAYDATRDAFIPRKPFPSWSLNEQSCQWEAPVPPPSSGLHRWDEDAQEWIEVA